MARLRYNGLTATLGSALTSSATSVTFGAALTHANGVAVPTISSPDYIPLSLLDSSGNLSEIVYLTAYTSGATTGTITRAAEGSGTAVAHNSGDRVAHGPNVADFARTSFKQRSSGDISVNSATWMNVDTGLDLTVPAQAGDVIECRMATRAFTTGTNIYLVLDFHTVVGGTPTTSIATGTASGTSPSTSHPGWATGAVFTQAQGYSFFTSSKRYTLTASDVSAGLAMVRLRAVSGGAVTVNASDPALYVELTNLGPSKW